MNTELPPSESLLAETKRLLNRYDLHAKKGLAQHFLINRAILDKIISAADLSPDDIVMEIGPGLGVLTRKLVSQAGWVIAVELDTRLVSILKESLLPTRKFSIVNRDILDVAPGNLLQDVQPEAPPGFAERHKYKVVANLPYYITSAVLRHFLEATVKPVTMVIMVQKEIARTIIAPPGDMSLLSVSVQFYGIPQIVTYVSAADFYPSPKVESAVLRIDILPQPAVDVADTESFFRLVKAGFSANRKQLINSLSHGLGIAKNDVLPLLEKAGINATRRAETLSITEWGQLYKASHGIIK